MATFVSKTEGVTGLGITVKGIRYRFSFPYETDDPVEIEILLGNGCMKAPEKIPEEPKHKEPSANGPALSVGGRGGEQK